MPGPGPTTSFDELLTHGAAVLLGAALAWSVVVVAAIVLEAITAGRIRVASSLGCPRWCHRWLLAVATAAVSAATMSPVAADDGVRPVPEPTPQTAPRIAPETAPERVPGIALDGLRLPDRPTGGPRGSASGEKRHRPQPEPRARTPTSVSTWVTVRSGDSLWEISRSRLPPDSADSTVAELTRALYLRNRSTIGSAPDLIHPGQHLAVPDTTQETYSEDS